MRPLAKLYSGFCLNENQAGKDARAPSSIHVVHISLLAYENRRNQNEPIFILGLLLDKDSGDSLSRSSNRASNDTDE